MEAAEWNSVVNHLRADSSLSPPRLARNLFSPDLVCAVSVWRKDGARLSMIGDGHYLNTILELGPTLVATAVRLEATLMRREMVGQPVTPSSFINSDKMASTLNAWPISINIVFFTLSVPLSEPFSTNSDFPLFVPPCSLCFYFSHLQWWKHWMQSPIIILGNPAEFELFNFLSVLCLSSCMGHICPCQPAACQKVDLS